MREKDIQTAILGMLLTHKTVAWAYITSTGTVKGVHGGRPFKIGVPGMPDIIGQLRDGRLLAIEVKQPKKEPTGLQVEFIDMINENNGVAGWATSVEEAKTIIDDACEPRVIEIRL